MLAFLASASGYSPIVRARPLMLPEAAAFYTSVVHGEELTPAQRLLLERRSLNEMKERFRVAGRYPPPVFDRRLPSCLLLARESEEGPILGCAGLELALVDDEKRIVLRRSRSEALLRERLDEGGAEAGAQAGGGASISPASGRRFHRPLLPDEMDEETAALRLQEAALELEGGERASLDGELSAAASSLPRSLRLLPLLSCVAVARGHRRRGVARELCLALQAEARQWGRSLHGLKQSSTLLAMVDEDNLDAIALLVSLGHAVSFRDEGGVATRAELPSPRFDRPIRPGGSSRSSLCPCRSSGWSLS
jgi:GNAT superfamily N-acetyltransferase